MQRIETSLPGVFELRPVVHRDARGFFIETYHKAKFADIGIADGFVQDNHSRSTKGTLRGLHYQLHHPQAKLCRVVEGEALDIALDVRVGSSSFGKWTSVLLSAEKQNQIFCERTKSDLCSGWVRTWFLDTHGFSTISLQMQRFLRSEGRARHRLE